MIARKDSCSRFLIINNGSSRIFACISRSVFAFEFDIANRSSAVAAIYKKISISFRQ